MAATTDITIAPKDVRSAVYVVNISPSASEKQVRDFFAFCGGIQEFRIAKDPASKDGGHHAVVSFKDTSAWQTALLLNDAQIGDRQISVRDYTDAFPEAAAAAAAAPAPAESAAPAAAAAETSPASDAAPVPQEKKSRTAIMAEMTANGFVLGTNALQKAREFDEKHFDIAGKAGAAAAAAKAKIMELNEKYKITDNVVALTAATLNTVDAKAKELDAKYHYTEKARDIELKVTAAAAVAGQMAMQNPTVAGVVQSTKNVIASATAAVTDFKQKTEEELARRKAARAAGAAGASEGDAPPAYEAAPAAGPEPASATPAASGSDAPAAKEEGLYPSVPTSPPK